MQPPAAGASRIKIRLVTESVTESLLAELNRERHLMVQTLKPKFGESGGPLLYYDLVYMQIAASTTR